MKKHLWTPIVALALAGGFVAEATAQANPNQLIGARKSAMVLQGKYFNPVLAMAMGGVPYDAAIAKRNADYLAVLTQLAWDDFQPHTVGGANTRAKEDIYKDAPKFKGRIDAFQADVKKLATAAQAGDQVGVTASAKAVGSSCNSCHEAFTTIEWRIKVQ